MFHIHIFDILCHSLINSVDWKHANISFRIIIILIKLFYSLFAYKYVVKAIGEKGVS